MQKFNYLLVGLVSIVLIGCGFKGPLYLPNEQSSQSQKTTASRSSKANASKPVSSSTSTHSL